MTLSGKPFSLAFKLLMVVAMAACVLILVPWASWAQSPCSGGACLDITVSPDPATVGQPLTITITVSCAPGSTCSSNDTSGLTDTLPSGLSNVSATASGDQPAKCTESAAGTVRCAPETYSDTTPFVVTISAVPTQCGTFSDTVKGAAPATFTVGGCSTPTYGNTQYGYGDMQYGYDDMQYSPTYSNMQYG
jgi:uncharacterized repeat protein (TIGR01451 family)